MLADLLARLMGQPASLGVAKTLGKKLGAAPTQQGDTYRVSGNWNAMRCQVVLDANADLMTATVRAGPQNTRWEIRYEATETPGLSYVSTQVALSPVDAARMEKLPMKVRLHVIEVVEAGQGSIRLEDGLYTLRVPKAGLARPNAAAQAAIRLDVLGDLIKAAARGL